MAILGSRAWAAATTRLELPAAGALARARVRRAPVVLAALVGGSFACRWLASLAHVVPYYFPDEDVYSALARGLAEHGRPLVRGAQSSFPALLEPLVNAPFWLVADQAAVLRLTQGLHALEVSLAAVPVYLLARRVGTTERAALACAALSLLAPDLVWAGFDLADPLGYLLALGATYAAVVAIDTGTYRAQAGFLLLAAAAALARTQYVALPLVFLASAFVVEHGSARRVLRRFAPAVAAVGAAAAGVVVGGLAGAFGPYGALLYAAQDPVVFFRSVALDLLIVAVASGFVLAPAALVGIDLVLSHPRSRAEHAFAATTVFLAGALAGLGALVPDPRVLERYVFPLVALVPIAFAVWLRRGAPRRRAAAALAAATATAALLLDLPARDPTHSPTLWALDWLSGQAGLPHLGFAVVAALGAAACVVALRCRGAVVPFAVAGVAMAVLSAGAYGFDRSNARVVRALRLPERVDWVDRAGLGEVTLLQTPGVGRPASLEQLFWNDTVTRVSLLPDATPLDFFAASRSDVRADGTLTVDARPLRGAVLVPRGGAALELVGARLVRRTRAFDLVRADGTLRVVSETTGRWRDGWLRGRATVAVWPGARGAGGGRVVLTFSLPATSTRAVPLVVRTPAGARRVVVRPGARTRVALRVAGPTRVSVEAARVRRLGGRHVSVRLAPPVFEPS